MSKPTVINLNHDNQVIDISDRHTALAIQGNSHRVTLNLARASLEIGSVVSNLGKNSTVIGSPTTDFIFAGTGSFLVGNGGDDTLQVSGKDPGHCVQIGGTGNDTLKAISSSLVKAPSCVLSGGADIDTFFVIGMRVMITDLEAGEKISLGSSNVQQFVTDEGLLVQTDKTEALILQRFEPLAFVDGTYLGF